LPQAASSVSDTDPVVENRGGASPFIILCDHASNFIPPRYGSLGLSSAEREAHVAWDPGALGVAREMARLLDASLVRATVSRLVIDCNRALDAPDLIATVSETTEIPGNAKITEAERLRRAGHDVVDFSVGEPDFPTPDHIEAAAHRALQDHFTKYTSNPGIAELREAVAHFAVYQGYPRATVLSAAVDDAWARLQEDGVGG